MPFDWSIVGVPQKPSTSLTFAGGSRVKPAPTTMSQSNSNSNILSSTSLCMFVKSHGSKARVVPFVNRETGEEFTKLMFPNATFQQGDLAGKTLSASWGKSLAGGLTAQQVAEQKDSLQVIEYLRPENYMVCRMGELRGEDVEVEW